MQNFETSALIEYLARQQLNALMNYQMLAKAPEKPKLNFGIDTILSMKCSTERSEKPTYPAGKGSRVVKHKSNKIEKSKQSNTIRSRTTFTNEQIAVLEEAFSVSKYIVGVRRSALAEMLNLDEKPVRIWFQHRRIRDRKEKNQRNSSQNFTESENSQDSESDGERELRIVE